MMQDFDFDAMIERIKAKKKELGMTNQQLSDASGVPYGTLNKILGSETKEPSINSIIKISAALNVSTEFIINGIEKNAPPENKWDALQSIMEQLPEDSIDEILSYAHYLEWKQDQQNSS